MTTEVSAERRRELKKLAKGGKAAAVAVPPPSKPTVSKPEAPKNAPIEEQKRVFIEMLTTAITAEEREEIFAVSKDFVTLAEFNKIVEGLAVTQAPADGQDPAVMEEPIPSDDSTVSIPEVPEGAFEDINLVADTQTPAPVMKNMPEVPTTRRSRRNQSKGHIVPAEEAVVDEDDPVVFLTDLGKAIRAEVAVERAIEREFRPAGERSTGRYYDDKPRRRKRSKRRGKNRREEQKILRAEDILEREFEPTEAMITMRVYIAERLQWAQTHWGIAAMSERANRKVFDRLGEVLETMREVELMRRALEKEERRARAMFEREQEEARAVLSSVKGDSDPKFQFPAPTKRRKPRPEEWVQTGEAGGSRFITGRLPAVKNPIETFENSLALKFASGEINPDAYDEKRWVLHELAGFNGNLEDALVLCLAEGKLSADEYGRLKFLRRQAQKRKEEITLAFARRKISEEKFLALTGE